MDVVNPVPGGITGLGLHITNHSYGITEDPLVPTDFLFYATIDAMKFSFRNHVLSVVAKGNSGTDGSAFPSVPADVRNEWVLCVGASGTDGEYKNFTNGDNFGFGPNCTPWASSYGGGIDIIAPGVTDIISTLINQVPTGDDFNCGYPAPLSVGVGANYQVFSGSSASAPHAAGVAALMHGLHNTEKGQYNNLAPEDYEYLFKEYATDISGGLNNYPVGADLFNGHGRINAGAILEKLEFPNWSVWHNFDPASEDITIEESTSTINSVEVTQYKITHTYHYVFSPSTQILDAWKRNSSVIGTLPPYDNNNYEAEFDFTINGNIADVTATTYFYKKEFISGQVSYFPTENIEDAKTRFSLHLYNPNGITSVKEITADNKNIKIFPNPTDGVFSLKHNLKGKFSSILNIFDTTGKVIFSDKVFLEENQSLKIDLQQFPNGIYFCQLKTDSGIYSSKVIKQ
jgi:hypothetical protein